MMTMRDFFTGKKAMEMDEIFVNKFKENDTLTVSKRDGRWKTVEQFIGVDKTMLTVSADNISVEENAGGIYRTLEAYDVIVTLVEYK